LRMKRLLWRSCHHAILSDLRTFPVADRSPSRAAGSTGGARHRGPHWSGIRWRPEPIRAKPAGRRGGTLSRDSGQDLVAFEDLFRLALPLRQDVGDRVGGADAGDAELADEVAVAVDEQLAALFHAGVAADIDDDEVELRI